MPPRSDRLSETVFAHADTLVGPQHCEDVVIGGTVSDEQAKSLWPDGWEAPRPYVRIVSQP
jgi:thioredoxin-dependent peroxiredoxin